MAILQIFGFCNVKYREKQYDVIENLDSSNWHWSVVIDHQINLYGESRTRSEALTKVVLAVDRSLMKAAAQEGH
jgi:hypothetical protein